MKENQKVSTLVKVLEWVCGAALCLALFSTIWACFVYRDRNGSFLPSLNNNGSAQSAPISKTLPAGQNSIPSAFSIPSDPNATFESTSLQQTQRESQKNISVAGFKTLRIDANTSNVSVDFYNPEHNAGVYLMTFELLLPSFEGSYESVYTSGTVEAGKHIRNIALSHPVPRGTYENCILHIQPYYISDGKPANTADITFTLYAE